MELEQPSTGWVVVPAEGASRCATCGVTCASPELLRAHTKEAWHLHNVKRKVAGLAPVRREEYEARAARAAAEEAEEPTKGAAHLKRREPRGEAGRERKAPPRAAGAAGTADELVSLFDGAASSSVPENLAYMAREFSFFLPGDDAAVVDRAGLLRFLHASLRTEHACFGCGQVFKDVGGCRQHMVDKGHTQLGELLREAAATFATPVRAEEDWQVLQPGSPGGKAVANGDLKLPSGRVATAKEFAYVYRQRVPQPSEAQLVAVATKRADAGEGRVNVFSGPGHALGPAERPATAPQHARAARERRPAKPTWTKSGR